ncbi:MAG: DNA polymerase III subunit delta, partial [Spirochaetota bacterium]
MSSIPSILLFLGPEDGLRAEELDSLRSRIKKSTGESADEHRVYLPDGSVAETIDLLQNGSLFSSHRLAIVGGAELIRKKDEVASIAAYCKSPPEGATLVLVSDAVRLDTKLEKAVPPNARKVFWELFENQKRGWVVSHFRKRNVDIGSDAV